MIFFRDVENEIVYTIGFTNDTYTCTWRGERTSRSTPTTINSAPGKYQTRQTDRSCGLHSVNNSVGGQTEMLLAFGGIKHKRAVSSRIYRAPHARTCV